MKEKLMLGLWILGAGALGVWGYKTLTSIGEGKAYRTMIDEFDSGQTIIMEKPNGEHIVVRKVNTASQ